MCTRVIRVIRGNDVGYCVGNEESMTQSFHHGNIVYRLYISILFTFTEMTVLTTSFVGPAPSSDDGSGRVTGGNFAVLCIGIWMDR
jgi:hypothetical protein